MRKLVTIQKIKEVLPIENADAIEMVKILGWQCVVKKDQFKKDDKCVYFEVDSFLPIEERYDFLVKGCYRNNEFMGEGLKIITQKFRGCLSQGLALPLTAFPELKDIEIDTDVSQILNVKKWDIPEVVGSSGTIIGNKPCGIPTTDETRIQSIDELRLALLGKPYYITTKMDGTSCTIYSINNKIGVCGRTKEYKDDSNCSMWEYAHKHNIPEKLFTYAKDIIIQGEFCGVGIQKNRLQLKEPELYVFNILDAKTMKLLPFKEFLVICDELKLNHVPIEEVGNNFNYSLEELIKKAKGKYPSGLDKEGIVVRPQNPIYEPILGKELSFKILNNDFLLKEK